MKEGETIKIVTHSMGTAYVRGYVEGLKKYAAEKKIKERIEYELDVNAFQGADLPAKGQTTKMENKTGGLDGGKSLSVMSVPTVDKVPGARDITDPKDADKGHDISKMSDTKILPLGNGGTPGKVEQGNNNANSTGR